MATQFSEFANVCKTLEATTKRTKKINQLAQFLGSLAKDEIAPTVAFFSGRAFTDSDKRVLDVSGRTLWKITCSSIGQSTLASNPISILEVYRVFEKIAGTTGPGSRVKKEMLIQSMINRMSDVEAEYFVRIIFGEMRIGAVEGVILEAIAKAATMNPDDIRRAYLLLGDISSVGKIALTEGSKAVRNVGVRLFVPIRPMLAEMATSIDSVLEEYHGRSAFEYKYDGARIQIHRKGPLIRIFSRRLTDVTESLPDIVDVVKKRIDCNVYLIEGEVLAIGKGEKPLPFQDLMRRFRRFHEVTSVARQIPLRLFLFDMVYRDGSLLIDKPYWERWRLLEEIAPKDLLATRIITSDPSVAKSMMEDSIRAGHEGLMAKDLKGVYSPGVRGKKWFKIKLAETLDLVIVAADWGSGRRRGWLSNYHLAVRDQDTGRFLMVGKTFKGLTDEEFAATTKTLLGLKISQNDYTVFVRPEMVVEVAFNEIQKSPHYDSKFALRFARIVRFRNDKPPSEADSIARLNILYRNQFQSKAVSDF